MAGIYIHIPFCKQACSYCDFHFSTNLSRKKEVLKALQIEMQLRKEYLNGETIETVYFGGGTPSLLAQEDLSEIFGCINTHFDLSPNAEITLEANPDDLSKTKLIELKNSSINRLSIGVQSFFNEDLKFMNRAHSSKEAFSAIQTAQDLGFESINLDLIFGGQSTSNAMWEQNLQHFFSLGVPHLSAYSLTIEEKTALSSQIKKGKLAAIEDHKNFEQYQLLQHAIDDNGYQQYEVSNYCLGENYSKHNTAYWQGKKYLGIGPSAHSFDGNSRQWNMRNNMKYIKALDANEAFFEKEILSEVDQYHEYLITALRTKWGIKKSEIRKQFSSVIQEHFENKLSRLNKDEVEVSTEFLKIKRPYLFQSDEVVRELMI